jgi:hypothetical protein
VKITIFSSNQARHMSLVRTLAPIANEIFYVCEVNTVFPGMVSDFYKKTDVFQEYFGNVLKSEAKVFGNISFIKRNVNILPVRMNDLSLMPMNYISEALESDVYIVFGASWIRGNLIEFLIDKKAVNIHMGVSPFYRGTACNFWAAYDGKPEYIGATIHYLSKGLDSGPIISHVFPEAQKEGRFITGMRSVKSAHLALADLIIRKRLLSLEPHVQDKKKQIRYSKKLDFNDEVASEFLQRENDKEGNYNKCTSRNLSLFHNPIVI